MEQLVLIGNWIVEFVIDPLVKVFKDNFELAFLVYGLAYIFLIELISVGMNWAHSTSNELKWKKTRSPGVFKKKQIHQYQNLSYKKIIQNYIQTRKKLRNEPKKEAPELRRYRSIYEKRRK